MSLFWRLVLAHLLADFTFQTDYIAGWKRKSLSGGVAHSLVFFVCGAALCAASLERPWLSPFGLSLNGWAALALLTLFHFLEDHWRAKAIRDRGAPDSLSFFTLDQFIHLSLIFVFFPAQPAAPLEKWVLLAIVFVLLTHFSSIALYYLEKEFTGSSQLEPRERYRSMAERLAAGLLLLLPGWWALSFPAAWSFRLLPGRGAGRSVSPFAAVSTVAAAVLFGLAARLIAYA